MNNQLFIVFAILAAAAVGVLATNLKSSEEKSASTRLESYGGDESYTQLVAYLQSKEGEVEFANALTTVTELAQWPMVFKAYIQQTGKIPSTEALWQHVHRVLPNSRLGYESSAFELSNISFELAPTVRGSKVSCQSPAQDSCSTWMKLSKSPAPLWGTYYILLKGINRAGLTDWSQIRNDGQAAAPAYVQQKLAAEKQSRLKLVQLNGQPIVRLGQDESIRLRLQTNFEHSANIAYYEAQQAQK